jgi:hypothetical protein
VKKAAQLFAFLILMASTSVVQAESRTRFERLQRAFHAAHQRATIEDFDADNWDHCSYTDVADPQTSRPTQVRTLQLSAPTNTYPSQRHTEYRVDLFSDPVVQQNIVSFFNSSYEVLNPNYFLQVLDGPSWSRMDIYGKRDGDVLLFELATSPYRGANAPMYAKDYGYCWNDTKLGPDAEPSSLPPAPDRPVPQAQDRSVPQAQDRSVPQAQDRSVPPRSEGPPQPRTQVTPPPPDRPVPPPSSVAKPKAIPVPKKPEQPAKPGGEDTTPMPLPPPPGA